MQASRVVTLLAFLAVGCAHSTVQTAERHEGWDGKDIAELIEVLGPFETTVVQRGVKSYNWFRFGNCRVTALVSPKDEKIVGIETEGTPDGCYVYRQRLSGK